MLRARCSLMQVICMELRGPGSLVLGGGMVGPGVGASGGAQQAEDDLQGLWGLAEMNRGF